MAKRGRPKGSKNKKRRGPGRPKGSLGKKTRARNAKSLVDSMIASGNIPKYGTFGMTLPRGRGRPKGSTSKRGKVTRAIVTVQTL